MTIWSIICSLGPNISLKKTFYDNIFKTDKRALLEVCLDTHKLVLPLIRVCKSCK
jgi:hypothetical protein